jgi:hypothetical protein
MSARKVDDAEPAHAQGETRRARVVEEEPFIVGAAMLKSGGHGADPLVGLGGAVCECGPANTTHALT